MKYSVDQLLLILEGTFFTVLIFQITINQLQTTINFYLKKTQSNFTEREIKQKNKNKRFS